MSNITYKTIPEHHQVRLDGKLVGTINYVNDHNDCGWVYIPLGSTDQKDIGECFPTLAACKRSLES